MDRGAVMVLSRSVNVCVLMNLESVVCVLSLVNFNPYQLKGRKGIWCLQLCSMSVLYGGTVEGSTLSVAVCVASLLLCLSVHVLACVCLCLCLCL